MTLTVGRSSPCFSSLLAEALFFNSSGGAMVPIERPLEIAVMVDMLFPMPRHRSQDQSGWRKLATHALQSSSTGTRLMMMGFSSLPVDFVDISFCPRSLLACAEPLDVQERLADLTSPASLLSSLAALRFFGALFFWDGWDFVVSADVDERYLRGGILEAINGPIGQQCKLLQPNCMSLGAESSELLHQPREELSRFWCHGRPSG